MKIQNIIIFVYHLIFENLSLPNLKTLKTKDVPSKSLTNLIENTKGKLTEINAYYKDCHNSKTFIQAIYQNCPNLIHLKLILNNDLDLIISEFESLLINCQFLNELIIIGMHNNNEIFSWDKLFKVLVKSSPISLLKFKFSSISSVKLEDLILFFDNWKNRDPMLLKNILR
jgi:hypothetical protein